VPLEPAASAEPEHEGAEDGERDDQAPTG
jgi:hypothetical protein